MDKIGSYTGTADSNDEFTEGDPSSGTPATEVDGGWLNAVQREMVKIIESMGLTLDTADDTLLWRAFQAVYGKTFAGDPNGNVAANVLRERCWDTSASPPALYVSTEADGTVAGTTWESQTPSLYGLVASPTESLLLRWRLDSSATRPRAARTSILDDLIGDLKEQGIWGKLDVLYVYAAHAERNGLYDLKSPSRALPTINSAPTFAVDAGYTGDGVDDYLDLGVSRQDLTLFARNSAHAGFFTLKDIDEAGNVLGSGPDFLLRPNDAGNFTVRLNNSTSITAAVGGGDGYFVAVRDAASSVVLYRNANEVGTSAEDSEALTADDMHVLEAASAFSAQQVAAIHAGSALTAGEVQTLYTILAAYLQEVEAI